MKKASVYCCKTLLVTTEVTKTTSLLLQTVTNFTPRKSNIGLSPTRSKRLLCAASRIQVFNNLLLLPLLSFASVCLSKSCSELCLPQLSCQRLKTYRKLWAKKVLLLPYLGLKKRHSNHQKLTVRACQYQR